MPRKRLLAGLIAVVALTGCGGSSDPAMTSASLVLDFTPNAVHAGIYVAMARHYPQQQGVALHVHAPGASTDSVKLLLSGRAQFAILDIHDLAIAREQGDDLVGVMAIVQQPLASVVALPPFKSPRDLEGHTVGVSGLPSDVAVLRSIVGGDGGDPSKVHQLTIGFNAVPDLIARKVDAATAFWNDEGLQVHARIRGAHVFRVDDFGAPAYPELVLTVTRAELRKHPTLVGKVVKALVHGYTDTTRNVVTGANALLKAVPSLDRSTVVGQLAVLLPAFTGRAPRFGDVDPARLAAWAAWEKKFGLVKRLPDTRAMFDNRYVLAASSATS
jgi:putative hydroxymethylpyrimidine transport system substrate-binding protein